MKLVRVASVLSLSLFTMFFLSCENEPLDADFLSEDGSFIPDDSENTDPGGDSSGDYWPLAVDNSWTYNLYADDVAQDDYDMSIGSTDVYQGENVFRFNQYLPSATGTDGTEFGGLEIDTYVRKNGGDYIISVGDLSASYLDGAFELSQTGYSIIILKDYVNVGTTWTSNVQTVTSFTSNDETFPDLPSITNNISNTLEVVEKDISTTVNGTTYNDVIKVKYLQETFTAAAPEQTTNSLIYYYFAKDVGLVKAEGTISDNADNITSTTLQELDAYTLN